MGKLKYPIGIQSFDKIRRGDYVYVDKTEYIHFLIKDCQYVFLSHPRRFGKSLLISTLKAFFQGRRDLFEGLAIAGHDLTSKGYDPEQDTVRLGFPNREVEKGLVSFSGAIRGIDSWLI